MMWGSASLRSKLTSKSTEPWVLGLGIVGTVALSFTVPLRGWWVVDCGLRFLELQSIVERNHWRGFWLDYPLAAYDPTYRFAPFQVIQTFVHDGKLYGQYPPWFCYLAAPFYLVAGRFGLRIVTLLAGILLLYGCYALARHAHVRQAAWAAVAVVFAAPILPYVYTFWDIVPAMAAGVWGMYFCLKAVESNLLKYSLLAALTLFFAFAMREEYLLWACCLFAAVFPLVRSWRAYVLAGAGFAVAAGALMFVNRLIVGHYLFFQASTGSGLLPEYSWSLSSRPNTAFLYLARVSGGYLGVSAIPDLFMFALLCALAWVPRASGRTIPRLLGIGILGAALVRVYLWAPGKPGVVQSHVISMAAATPFVFLGLLLWLPSVWNWSLPQHRRRWGIVTTSLAFLVASVWLSVQASAIGLNFGPRLLLPAYPGLMISAIAVCPSVLKRISPERHRRLAGLMLGLLLTFGVVDNVVFLERLKWKVTFSDTLYRVVRDLLPSAPILTDQGRWASDPAELYFERPILSLSAASQPELQKELIEIAKRINPKEALVLSNKKSPPRWLRSYGTLEPISLEGKIEFLAGSFITYPYRLRYHQTNGIAPSDIPTSGPLTEQNRESKVP
ncbi:MAG: hypothetical protein N2644_00170 [Candidatus Sumerlaea chitinivorans]|nr:hypothetical protein [Candidatus Sumerlaea chitinivorans]